MTSQRAVIDPARCDRSPGCPASKACPAGAIEREDNEAYFVNSYCQGCRKCLHACPKKAIRMV